MGTRSQNVIIEKGVRIGKNVRIGHNVILKSGTVIRNNVVIADNCCTTGLCYIGNNVQIRTNSCISKGVILNDWAFVGAGVMTSHTKHIRSGKCLITEIGYGAILGSGSNFSAGVKVGNNAVVGYSSLLLNDADANFIYAGIPAQRVKRVRDEDRLCIPMSWSPYMFEEEDLEKYLEEG